MEIIFAVNFFSTFLEIEILLMFKYLLYFAEFYLMHLQLHHNICVVVVIIIYYLMC